MGAKCCALFRGRVSAPVRVFPTGCQREGSGVSNLEVPRSLDPRKEEEEENTALGATPSILLKSVSVTSVWSRIDGLGFRLRAVVGQETLTPAASLPSAEQRF